jgi:hypothetical protein
MVEKCRRNAATAPGGDHVVSGVVDQLDASGRAEALEALAKESGERTAVRSGPCLTIARCIS